MQSLHNSRGWMAFTLVLALVLTMGGLPAAVACGVLVGPAGSAASAVMLNPGAVCRGGEMAGACCCRPTAEQHAAPQPHSHWSQPGCGCSLNAPPAAPVADLKASRFLLHLDGWPLSSAAVSLSLSTETAPVLLVPVLLAPRAGTRGGAPPRAPPAC
jgi:hypothetical protein